MRLSLTRTELRIRNPDLKIKNLTVVDRVIEEVNGLAIGWYKTNGTMERGINEKTEEMIKAALDSLDEPGRAAFLDYLEGVKEMVQSHFDSSPL